MDSQLVETWQIHNRINLYIFDHISAEAFAAPTKGRTIGEQFAHMHNNRLDWLEHSAPDLFSTLVKLEQESSSETALVRHALDESGQAIATLIQRGIEAGGKIKNYKPHVTAFMAYLIAHEGYHRGEIGMIL